LGLGLIALAVIGTSEYATAGSATPESILVMPARKRVVHLAFQLARCKDIGLVTYNTTPSSDPLIHVWNGQEWVQITVEDFAQGSFMSGGEPRHVFILGDLSQLPAHMTATPGWCKDVQKISSLDTAFLINQLGKTLNFSSTQWTWLAEVNGLKLKDLNFERRHYGRWGASGNEHDLNPAKQESAEMPPAVPVVTPEAPKGEPVKPVEAKVEYKIEQQVTPACDTALPHHVEASGSGR